MGLHVFLGRARRQSSHKHDGGATFIAPTSALCERLVALHKQGSIIWRHGMSVQGQYPGHHLGVLEIHIGKATRTSIVVSSDPYILVRRQLILHTHRQTRVIGYTSWRPDDTYLLKKGFNVRFIPGIGQVTQKDGGCHGRWFFLLVPRGQRCQPLVWLR